MTSENRKYPALLSLAAFGDLATGILVSTQKENKIPFAIKRVFWIQQVPPAFKRGNHAGHRTEEIIVALQGRVEVHTESKAGRQSFVLDRPDEGLYIPAKCWISLNFSANALLLCLASTDYDEKDYIYDYAEFQQICTSIA